MLLPHREHGSPGNEPDAPSRPQQRGTQRWISNASPTIHAPHDPSGQGTWLPDRCTQMASQRHVPGYRFQKGTSPYIFNDPFPGEYHANPTHDDSAPRIEGVPIRGCTMCTLVMCTAYRRCPYTRCTIRSAQCAPSYRGCPYTRVHNVHPRIEGVPIRGCIMCTLV